KLAPKTATVSYNKWVSYFWTTQTSGTAAAGATPFLTAATYKVAQATRETMDAANLVNNGGGSCTYTFAQNLATATMPSPFINPTATALVGYDNTLHKIHAGNELASVVGTDGQYYDNPNTVADETAEPILPPRKRKFLSIQLI
ncbi:MAG: hypothetical protein WA133_03645, partial [Syntrophales bacterium]